MKSIAMIPETVIWLLLMVLTVISWQLGTAEASLGEWAAAAILALAVIKIRLVIRYFMEIGEAPLTLKLITDVWCAVVLFGMLFFYYLY